MTVFLVIVSAFLNICVIGMLKSTIKTASWLYILVAIIALFMVFAMCFVGIWVSEYSYVTRWILWMTFVSSYTFHLFDFKSPTIKGRKLW
jgi:hypothetical protein